MIQIQKRDRISVIQARKTLMVAFVLGLIFTLFQLLTDYRQESNRLEKQSKQMLAILDQPASLAAYQKDKDYARSLIVGYFSLNSVYEAKIYDAQGELLASQIGELQQGPYRDWVDLIFGETIPLQIDLFFQPRPTGMADLAQLVPAGRVEVSIDTYEAGSAFYDRAVRIMVGGFLRNFTLSVVLLFIFHRFLTRPFLQVAEELNEINPELMENPRLQIPKGHEKDEFSMIVTSANDLLAAIEKNMQSRMDKAAEAARLSTEIQVRQAREEEMRRYQKQLEDSNVELERLLGELHETQDALIESKTLSSLGGLVAGVAHELNTPMGVAVSSSSFLQKRSKELREAYQNQSMTEASFLNYLQESAEMMQILQDNLNRAAELVQSFKKTAVDQSRYFLEEIPLKDYLDLTLKSLEPEYKKRPIEIRNQCPADLKIKSYPGALSQVVINFVQNSLIHAFEPEQTGLIELKAIDQGAHITLIFSDNGKGIEPEHLAHIFEPFYTSRPNKGGTGLGLNITYNLVKQKMHGSITVQSELGQGTRFILVLPKQIEE